MKSGGVAYSLLPGRWQWLAALQLLLWRFKDVGLFHLGLRLAIESKLFEAGGAATACRTRNRASLFLLAAPQTPAGLVLALSAMQVDPLEQVMIVTAMAARQAEVDQAFGLHIADCTLGKGGLIRCTLHRRHITYSSLLPLLRLELLFEPRQEVSLVRLYRVEGDISDLTH